MNDLLAALALVIILEGLVLITLTNRISQIILIIERMSERKVKSIGYIMVIVGVLFLWFIRF